MRNLVGKSTSTDDAVSCGVIRWYRLAVARATDLSDLRLDEAEWRAVDHGHRGFVRRL